MDLNGPVDFFEFGRLSCNPGYEFGCQMGKLTVYVSGLDILQENGFLNVSVTTLNKGTNEEKNRIMLLDKKKPF